MTCHLTNIVQPNSLFLTRENDFESRLDHQNLCIRIRWHPKNWSGWYLEIVLGRQNDENSEVFMRGCGAENLASVMIVSGHVGDLQSALDEFFTDLNDCSRKTSDILNVECQPTPILPGALISEIRGCCERIRQSLFAVRYCEHGICGSCEPL